MSTERPFKIAVPDEELDFLKKKLGLIRFPDELENAGRDYGAPLKDIQRLIAYWKDGYDWRKHEAQLNEEMPQFTRDIKVEGFEALNVHYVHKRSEVSSAIPLLFVHGWPGSFLEARKILPLLVDASQNHPSFHLVAISLPGYGFSESPKKRRFGIPQYAEMCHKLMLALGYNQYVTQGGDWGGLITHQIATKYGPKHARARHTNFPITSPPHILHNPTLFFQYLITPLSAAEKAGLQRTLWFRNEGRGYFMEQSTQPQTLGYSLADSPAGLLSWIYEKLVNWSDAYPWTDDEVLTWISIYWFSRAGPAASVRIYYEFAKSGMDLDKMRSVANIPTGHSYFPKELFVLPRYWLKARNVVFESQHESGGHFAAYERPEALVDDLRNMYGKGARAFGIVTSHSGFKL